MICIRNILPIGMLAAWLFLPAAIFAADDAASKPDAKPVETAKPAKDKDVAKPARELTPAQTALRDLVRQTLAAHQKDPFNTQENSATEIANYCLAFGCGTQVSSDAAGSNSLNGITALCYNYPCAGFEMLTISQNRIAARIGYGCQERPGELLAVLALSRVPSDYPVRVGSNTRTVADLIETEKLGCRSGSDLSLKLIGLSYYVDEAQWTNDLGEMWSIDRMLRDEMAKPVVTAAEGGLNRLMGLSYAVSRRAKRGQPIDGQFQRAQTYVADFQSFALQLQNADGSWGPYFLAAKSSGSDATSQLRSTGRVLEWLAFSLPEKKLDDARVMGAVEYVAQLLGSQQYQGNVAALSTRDITALGHALHALSLYDDRVFKPADVVEPPAAEKQSPTAARDAKAPQQR